MQSDALTLLAAILPSEGWYCGWRKDTKEHFWTRSLEELAQWLLAIGQHTDVYHCLASFRQPTSRSAANVFLVRTFRLDLDAGPTKPYASAQEALSAFSTFAKAHALPRPYVVGSGGGVHIYWPLHDAIDPDAFVSGAWALRRLTEAAGLQADPVCTIGPERILRTPGSWNFKEPTPRPVTLLCAGAPATPERLGLASSVAGPVVPARRTPARGHSLTAQLARGDDTPDADADRIAEHCGQVAHMRRSQGDMDEPYWRACIGVLSRCHNGRERAHEWSRGPRYDQRGLDDRFDRWLEQDGPATCSFLSQFDPAPCNACPHAGRVTTPVQLGRAPPEPEVVGVIRPTKPRGGKPWGDIPALPPPFVISEAGALCWEGEDAAGMHKLNSISPRPVYLANENKGETHDASQALVVRAWWDHDGWSEIELPVKTMFGAQGVTELEAQGVVVTDHKMMLAFLRASRAQLKMSQKMDTRYEQFGWKFGNKAFALGRTLLRPDGEQPVIGTEDYNKRALAFQPAGSKQAWTDAVQNFAEPGLETLAYMCSAAFAAPLMQFHCGLGQGGGIVHGWSPEGGSGKSTSMFAGMAGLCNPALAMIKPSDTVNSRADLFALFHTLPICFDEFQKMDPEDLNAAVLQFISGEDKARLTQTGQRVQRNGRWATLLLTTGNCSLMNTLGGRQGSTALMDRIVELRFPDTKREGNSRLYRTFQDHYGHAGQDYFRYIVRPDVNKWMREHEMPRVEGVLRDEYGLGSAEDRCLLAIHTCVWVAIEMAKTLGLLRWSARRIVEAGLKSRDTMKKIRGDRPTMVDLLGQLLEENQGYVVVVDGAPKRNGEKQVPRNGPRYSKIYGRFEADTGVCYFSWAQTQKFLRDQGVSTHEFYTALRKQGLLMLDMPRHHNLTLDVRDVATVGRTGVIQVDGYHPLLTGRSRLESLLGQQKERSDAQLAPRSP